MQQSKNQRNLIQQDTRYNAHTPDANGYINSFNFTQLLALWHLSSISQETFVFRCGIIMARFN